MIIREKGKKLKLIEEIKAGECFESDGNIYIKTDAETNVSVMLETGAWTRFASWICVTPVEVEAVVLDD